MIALFSLFQIVIPFFSLLIKDIIFLNEGCANRLPNGHVNFEVCFFLFFFFKAVLLKKVETTADYLNSCVTVEETVC